MRTLLLGLTALLLPASILALYSKGDAVVQLTPSNFDDVVNKGDGVSVVEFFAPWCGHCKNLSPHYKNVAQKLQGIVTLGAVDCDQEANKKLCSSHGIKGYPTVKLFGADKMKNPYTGEIYRDAVDYQGPLTAKAVMEAATSLLTDVHITRLATVDDFEAFSLNRPEVAKVMLFTSKKETPAMYKSISMQLHRGLDFAEVHEGAADLVAMHEVQDFPTVLVSKADGSSEVYGGGLKATQLLDFLKPFSSVPPEPSSSSSDSDDRSSSSSTSDKKAPGSQGQEVGSLALEEAIALDEQEDMWLLGLYSPDEASDCADSVTQFKKAVSDMQDVVKAALVTVPAEQLSQASRYGINPSTLRADGCALQLVLLPFGEDKEDAEDYAVYSGELDGKALQKWVTEAIPSSFTSEVSPASFQYFMTPGTAAQPKADSGEEHGSITKVLLFTNKDEVPGVYKALATNFRNSFGFGWVQSGLAANKQFVKQFEVTKVPALQVITLTPVEGKDGRPSMYPRAIPYMGPLRYNSMAAWLTAIQMMMGGAAGAQNVEGAAEKLVPEVTDDDSLEAACSGKGGICVLGLLDPSHDKFEVTKKMLVDIAAKRDGQPFHFCWIDASKYRPVAAAFGVIPRELPSVVALSAKRMRYSTLAAKDAESIGAFMDGVLSGKVRTEILQELPKVQEGSAAESGSAEQEMEVVEEEFDLSDILSEEVEGADLGSKGDRLKQVEEELRAEEEAKAAAKKTKKKSKKKSKKSKSKSDKSEL